MGTGKPDYRLGMLLQDAGWCTRGSNSKRYYERVQPLGAGCFLWGELRWRGQAKRWEALFWADLASDGVCLLASSISADPVGLAKRASEALARYEAALRLGWRPGNQGGG